MTESLSGADGGPTSSRSQKKKYRPRDGADYSKRTIDGPGVWVTCVKGKEKQTVGELYDLFESVAAELWPLGDARREGDRPDDDDEDLSIEAEIARELSAMKRPRKASRFANCQTNTPCVVFISCKDPVDPVNLVVTHIKNVKRTGVTHTRYAHRFVPVSGTCIANVLDIESLCNQVFEKFFAENEGSFRYKVELRIRNHNTHTRTDLIQYIVNKLPPGHTVDLVNPEIFILAEVFKSVFGVSVVKEYYALQKFNVLELSSNSKPTEERFGKGDGRVGAADVKADEHQVVLPD